MAGNHQYPSASGQYGRRRLNTSEQEKARPAQPLDNRGEIRLALLEAMAQNLEPDPNAPLDPELERKRQRGFDRLTKPIDEDIESNFLTPYGDVSKSHQRAKELAENYRREIRKTLEKLNKEDLTAQERADLEARYLELLDFLENAEEAMKMFPEPSTLSPAIQQEIREMAPGSNPSIKRPLRELEDPNKVYPQRRRR